MALIAILALAPNGKQSRALLQEMLWGRSGAELGRASLRRALSDLRKIMGASFSDLFTTTNADVTIDQSRIRFEGGIMDGPFLDGITILEPRFTAWIEERRNQVVDRRLRQPSIIAASLSPSICVVPFSPPLGDSYGAQIGDLMAMEISRALASCPMIDVISHLSSRRLQFHTLDLVSVRSEMNADYLVTGSYRLDSRTLFLSIDFVDLQSERLIWSDRFDLPLQGLTCSDWVQTADIARRILDGVIVQSICAVGGGAGHGLQVHQRLMAAISLMHQQRREVVKRARTELDNLVSEHPEHAMLHAWLAKLHVLSVHQGWETPQGDHKAAGLRHSKEALRLDPSCSFSLGIAGLVQSNLLQDFTNGARMLDEALDLDNSNALAWLLKGAMLAFRDQGAEAVLCTTKARTLSPLDPHKYYYDCLSATAHLTTRDFATAKHLADRSYSANPRHASTLRVQIIANHELGAYSDAQSCAHELMALQPDFTVSNYLRFHPAAAFQTGDTWARALANSGVPQA